MSQPFDLARTPLEDGITLIEASAGTGKTYTIAGLVLRLLLETPSAIREILVVTFTEAATSELRERVRQTIAQARQICLQPVPPDTTAFPAVLFAGKSPDDLRAARFKLESALRDFDEAAIFTIHAFCNRVLRQQAFETGSLFDTELLEDEEEISREIAEDYWRRHFYRADPFLVRLALLREFNLKTLASLLHSPQISQDNRILARASAPDGPRLLADLRLLRERLAELLEQRGDEFDALFLSPSVPWGNKPYRHDKDTDALRRSLDDLRLSVLDPDCPPSALESLVFFSASAVSESVKKNAAPPSHPVLDLCDALLDTADQYFQSLKLDFIIYAREERDRRKRDRNVLSFDNLLRNLDRALRRRSGAVLAEVLRQRHHAALIDEFQDTDRLQYTIFRSVFLHPAHRLFLIGDPKQAIYAFRGAEIFTYLRASQEATRRYTLTRNWRSESALVHAVNTLFHSARDPFVLPDIAFAPVQPAGHADADRFALRFANSADPVYPPPLQLWLLPPEESGDDEDNDASPSFVLKSASRGKKPPRPLAKEKAARRLARATALEIRRLLRHGFLGDRPLAARDIAVLVPRNDQAQLMQETLSAHRLPSVLQTSGSVWASPEAEHLQRLLLAINAPGDEGLVKTALVSPLLGLGGDELERMTRHEAEWEIILEQFTDWQRRWREQGFMPMFRHLLREKEIRPRLLANPGGERSLTNLLHLGELLQNAAARRRLGPDGLLHWISRTLSAIREGARRLPPEDQQMRLERDEEAIRIVTIHRSKGLEYPVVFCPFSWSGGALREDNIVFHQSAPPSGHSGGQGGHDDRPVWDLGSEDLPRSREHAGRESLAEQMRLLYVALTRAQHRCYLAWGRIGGAPDSGPAYLLHQPQPPGGGESFPPGHDLVLATRARAAALLHPEILADLRRLVARAPDALALAELLPDGALPPESAPPPAAVSDPSADPGPPLLRERALAAPVPQAWRVTSFTALTRDLLDSADDVEPEAPDHDADTDTPEIFLPPEPVAVEAEPSAFVLSRFNFPKGAQAGKLLHALLETTDFSLTDPPAAPTLRDHSAALLSAEGFLPEYASVLEEWIRNILRAPLALGDTTFRLEQISLADTLREMEFHLPARDLSTKTLARIFADQPAARSGGPLEGFPARLRRLADNGLAGYLKGFLDLIVRHQGRYYLLDWKSNWLGDRREDYTPAAVRKEMLHGYYHLQYHLYTVALHRLLARRLPGYDYQTHFGGVHYLFLRGLHPDRPGLGLYSDLPALDLIEELDQLFT